MFISCTVIDRKGTVHYIPDMYNNWTEKGIEMIDITIGALFITSLVCFVAGFKLGRAVGMNDGIRRAHNIMDEVHGKCAK